MYTHVTCIGITDSPYLTLPRFRLTLSPLVGLSTARLLGILINFYMKKLPPLLWF